MTSPQLPIGGSAAAGSTAPPPPPPPPPGGSNVTAPAAATATVTAVVTGGPPPGSSAVTIPTTATATATATVSTPSTGNIPAYDHVVMVLLENHGYTQLIGSSNAPYINSLVPGAALFTDSHGGPDTLHPSFPNYMQLFSGGNQGVVNDNCPPAGQPFAAACQASSLIAAGKTFAGFAESKPAGFTACGPSPYAGRHVPWVWFSGVPQAVHKDFSAFPTTSGGYAALEHLSWVVPDLSHDMHSFGSLTDAQTIQSGDSWLHTHIDGYAQWAKTNNSLLVLQWDEDNFTTADRIPTLFIGQHVKPGQYSEHITHYNILRTLSDVFGAKPPGKAATATPITDCWN